VKIVKKTLLLALLTGVLAFAQQPAAAVNTTPYSPNDMKIMGTLDNGQTSKLVQYSGTPQYRAFVFEGNGHDQVEVTVTGDNRKAFIALADSTLVPIASGTEKLIVTLPYHGPDTEAFYIVFKDGSNRPARLAVHLKKIASGVQPADATR
jgi:hypothetical protein